jgi:hypothetical protein
MNTTKRIEQIKTGPIKGMIKQARPIRMSVSVVLLSEFPKRPGVETVKSLPMM